ncbi:DUF1742-domain-containing protein [Delitschia confertaspora ATCC 74209]|uniref:DUF1742-domain-containing protein n=1 Tax=Delitschia confertaspora ATCC 74209 TaxID=1513339 RepID=A0A9P4MR81_9PLEO|nr:DUF1742-domain-containing protein [Delitschia confertaspora ATCC 74209]
MSASTALPNTWHHRRVAEASAKPCWICYKPTSSVLITPDNKDFFYICVGHLKDKGFCQPDAAEAAAVAAKKKEELEQEIRKVVKEYEEKKQRKKEKQKEKDKGKDKESKEDKKKSEDEDKKDQEDFDGKMKELSKSKEDMQADEGPRIYSLNKNFYQMRVDRIRNAEIAKRNRERLKNPSLFPSVPSGDP